MRALVLLKKYYPYALFVGVFFLLGFIYKYHLPKIENWILVKLEEQSRQHLPVRIWPQRVRINLLPLGVTVYDIKIKPQADAVAFLKATTVQELEVKLSPWGLLRGQMRIGYVRVKGAEFDITLADNPETDSPQGFDLKILGKIPVDEIVLQEVGARIRHPKFYIEVSDISLDVENKFQSLLVDLDINLKKLKATETNIDDLHLDTRFLLQESGILVSSLKTKVGESYAVSSGEIKGSVKNARLDFVQMKARTHLNLSGLTPNIKSLIAKYGLTSTAGQLFADAEISSETNQKPKIDFKIQSQDLALNHFVIGDLDAEGEMRDAKIKTPRLRLKNSATSLVLDNFEIDLNDAGRFKSTVAIQNFELGQLLANVTVPDVPILLNVKGEVPCEGAINANFKIKCQGTLTAPRLVVKSGIKKNDQLIYAMENATVTGEVEVDKEKVSYTANLALAKSKGKSSGVISYAKGFDIKYEGELENLKEIGSLVNLQLEGSGTIRGSTYGDSSRGIVALKFTGQNLWLEDYQLGRASMDFTYKSSMLYFDQIQGHINNSRYSGDIAINIAQEQIMVKTNTPYVEAGDLADVFVRKVKLPFEVTGSGSGSVRAWGPLQFNKLSYDVTSSFFRGSVADEAFDEIHFNVKATDGNVRAEKITASKGSGRLELNGKVNSRGIIDAVVLGRDLRLEQSEYVQRLGLDATAQVDFSLTLKGEILRPDTEINGRISKTVLGEQSAEDSKFKLRISHTYLDGQADLLNGVLTANFKIPFQNEAPFKLQVHSEDWNYLQFFSLFNQARQKNYDARVSGDIDLEAPTGGLFNSTGTINIDKFYLQRSSTRIEATKPILVKMRNGIITTNNFNIEGPDNFLRIRSQDSSAQNLHFAIDGKLDLALMSFLAPGLEDLRGQLSLSTTVSGPLEKPELGGSGVLSRGHIRLKGLQHAFEDISSEILFSHNAVYFNSIRAGFATGAVQGEGKINFAGSRNVPLDFHVTFQNVSLNIPQGFLTKGYGNLAITGNWPPYLLSGAYNITYGDITRNFDSAGVNLHEVKASTFLPKFLAKETVQPLNFNLDLIIKNSIMVRSSVTGAEVEAPIDGQLKILGNYETPKLNGRLTANKGGKIVFRSNTFDVRYAQLEYRNTPPENPEIHIEALTRVTTTDARFDYDVNLLIQGQPKNPKLTLNSQPPLPETEIISLLALGMTSSDLEKAKSTTSTSQSSFQIGSALIRNQLGLNKEIKNKLGVEFELSTVDSQDATVPRVTLKKQWTPKFEATASRTIEPSPNNNVKLEYKVNRNTSVLGFWENRDTTVQGNQKQIQSDTERGKVGIDLEYKFEFK